MSSATRSTENPSGTENGSESSSLALPARSIPSNEIKNMVHVKQPFFHDHKFNTKNSQNRRISKKKSSGSESETSVAYNINAFPYLKRLNHRTLLEMAGINIRFVRTVCFKVDSRLGLLKRSLNWGVS